MKKLPVLAAILILAFIATSCEKNNSDLPPFVNISLDEKSQQLVFNANDFGFELFNQLENLATETENVCISPLSASMALTMTYNGAANETQQAMAEVLRFNNLTIDEVNTRYKSLIVELLSVDPQVECAIANSIWYRNNFDVKQSFIDVNQDNFDAEVAALDFSDPQAKDIINAWVEDKTNNRIKDLVKNINPDQAMFLINALFFKGDLRSSFDASDTYFGNFYLMDETTEQIEMMSQTQDFNYYNNDLFQMLEMPYSSGNFNMVVLLPYDTDHMDEIVADLNNANWTDWTNSMYETEVAVQFPKFTFEYEKEFDDALKNMGMAVAFTSAADFSGIVQPSTIYIDYVKQKTFIEVNEEGTEAAAATVVSMVNTSAGGPVSFTANKPFLFAITEKSTQTVLFFGKFVEPN